MSPTAQAYQLSGSSGGCRCSQAPAAEKRPLAHELLQEQLGRLGETGFELSELKLDLEGSLIVPMSEINRLRRDLIERLTELREQPPKWKLNSFNERGEKIR